MFGQQKKHGLAVLWIDGLRGSIASINQRCFEGQEVLFPAVVEGFDQLQALVEKLVGNYNEDFADSIEGAEELLEETKNGQQPSRSTIDFAGLIENAQGAATAQVAYLVDMAKADALGILGENRQALELVDRHV